MEIKLTYKQRVKAFFKEGKPCLILKLKLPFSEGESKISERINAFYDAVFKSYVSACEALSSKMKKPERPFGVYVSAEEKMTEGALLVTRAHKLRLPNGEISYGEAADLFDASTGHLIREKRFLKRIMSEKKKAVGT